MTVRLYLFGAFRLLGAQGPPIELTTRNDRALLAYMALHGSRAWEREHLAGLIWFDRGEAQARKSLRQSLVSLRRALGPAAEAIAADGRSRLHFDAAGLEVDALRLAALERDGGSAALAEAADLYAGPLLADLKLRSPGYDAWLQTERAHYADRVHHLIGRLGEAALAEGNGERAATFAHRLIAIDGFRESGHRLLMRALARQGRGSEALAHYKRVADLLRRELDVRPDPDTEAVRAEIARAGTALMASAAPVAPHRSTADGRRPSLIVLPIRVAEPADLVIARGLTDELVAGLAAYRWFTVMSALQSEVYRGQVVQPVALASELGVRYLVDVSLERSGNRLRLAVALVQADNGAHLWSDRIDCFADEVFATQDGVARQIARLIEPELLAEEGRLATRIAPRNLTAWQLAVRAYQLVLVPDATHNDAGLALATEAVAVEDESAYAHAMVALAHWLRVAFKLCTRDEALPILDAGVAAAQRSVDRDPRFYLGHAARGMLQIRRAELDQALVALRAAINLNPSWPPAYNQLASGLTYVGRPHEALEHVLRVQKISPSDPYAGYYACVRATVHYFTDDDERTIDYAGLSVGHHPGWYRSMLLLVAANQRAGRTEAAQMAAADFRRYHGTPTRAEIADSFPLRREVDWHKVIEPLTAAGLPRD